MQSLDQIAECPMGPEQIGRVLWLPCLSTSWCTEAGQHSPRPLWRGGGGGSRAEFLILGGGGKRSKMKIMSMEHLVRICLVRQFKKHLISHLTSE